MRQAEIFGYKHVGVDQCAVVDGLVIEESTDTEIV